MAKNDTLCRMAGNIASGMVSGRAQIAGPELMSIAKTAMTLARAIEMEAERGGDYEQNTSERPQSPNPGSKKPY